MLYALEGVNMMANINYKIAVWISPNFFSGRVIHQRVRRAIDRP